MTNDIRWHKVHRTYVRIGRDVGPGLVASR